MDIRELQERDLPALLDLCAAALPHDTFSLALLQRRTLGDPQYHQPYQLCAWEGGQLQGAAIGVRRAVDEGVAGGLLLLAVAPSARRRGVATALLDELERRMRADGITRLGVGGTTPNFFWAGVDMRYTPAYCLLLSRGYTAGDIRVNQIVDLQSRSWATDEDEARLAGVGITIERADPADRAALSEYLSVTWGPWWQAEALNGFANTPATTFVARQHGRYCAFASFNSEGFDGHFGPTGTDDALRGQGIGRVLFYRCMRELAERGLRSAEVVWVGPIPFYTRVAGAIVHRAFWSMERSLS